MHLLSAGLSALKETEMYQDTLGVAVISGASCGHRRDLR